VTTLWTRGSTRRSPPAGCFESSPNGVHQHRHCRWCVRDRQPEERRAARVEDARKPSSARHETMAAELQPRAPPRNRSTFATRSGATSRPPVPAASFRVGADALLPLARNRTTKTPEKSALVLGKLLSADMTEQIVREHLLVSRLHRSRELTRGCSGRLDHPHLPLGVTIRTNQSRGTFDSPTRIVGCIGLPVEER